MSGLYEALKRAETEQRGSGAPVHESANPAELLSRSMVEAIDPKALNSIKLHIAPTSRLVALTEPRSIGAEKFRALAMRLEHLQNQHELRSMQVTSSVDKEGKSLIAGNLAATLSRIKGKKVLLVEGDLHRPMLTSLLGLKPVSGLAEWWAGRDDHIISFVSRLDNMHLWILNAGKPHDLPSDILQSARFAQAFKELNGIFDWIVVDSPPIRPTVDVNLWSRLVDGALLIVRENTTPIKTLKKALESLDDPRLIGIVLNEASEFDQRSCKYFAPSGQR